MRNKIATLTVCITLVYWLGGLTGCATSPQDAQNEEMLKEDKSIFDVSPPGEGGNQFKTRAYPNGNVVLAALQTSETITEEVDLQTDGQMPVESAPKQVTSDDGTSITGIDRSTWSPITVNPLIGDVTHSHTYWADKEGRIYTHTTVDLDEGSDAAMKAALDDIQCHTYKKREWASALIQPLEFCWDTFTLPYNATVKQPFWVDSKQEQGE